MKFPEQAVWDLVEGAWSLSEFQEWVIASETFEREIGPEIHLALLEDSTGTTESVLRTLQSWAEARYSPEINLVLSYRVIARCHDILAGRGELLLQVRELLSMFGGKVDTISDDAWHDLVGIDSESDEYPVGVDESLVSDSLMKRMRAFEHAVRADVLKACQLLVDRHSRPQSDG